MRPYRSTSADWPALSYKDWEPTCSTLHLWIQIVGKARLAQTPWINHSWHATLYLHAGLAELGIAIAMHDRPNELPVAIPFAEDRTPRPYDADAARRFFRALLQVRASFGAFAPASSAR